ncbi:MAG: hypothetical protein WC551_08675 [Patescibacteria group bacterium]
MDFKKNNTKRVNDIQGFTMCLPQWTRTLRSCLKNWRWETRWEKPEGFGKEHRESELVVRLVEDASRHSTEFETQLVMWRIPKPNAAPDPRGIAEGDAGFRVAQMEWLLGTALMSTIQPLLDKLQQEHEQTDRKLKVELLELRLKLDNVTVARDILREERDVLRKENAELRKPKRARKKPRTK